MGNAGDVAFAEQRKIQFQPQQEVMQVEHENLLLKKAETYEADHDYGSVAVLQSKYREKLIDTTFQQREEYFFQDTKKLEDKAKKYRGLSSSDDVTMSEYAAKYEYRSARKRKNYSGDAADAFGKALQKTTRLKEREDEMDMTPLEKYRAREEILRLRMKGMVDAAKAKAMDKKNEAYRVGKARYACLIQLQDHLENLMGKEGGREYEKIKARLDKELKGVESNLKKTDNLDQKRKELSGVTSQLKETVRLDEKKKGMSSDAASESGETDSLSEDLQKEVSVMDQMLKKAQSVNPEFNEEDLFLREEMRIMNGEMNRKEIDETLQYIIKNGYAEGNTKGLNAQGDQARVMMFMVDFVRRDKDGNPIGKLEAKKDERNRKWLELMKKADPESIEERKKMILEKFKEIEDFKLPTLDEIDKNGAMHYYHQDTFGYQNMFQKAVSLDHFIKLDPFAAEYFNSHPTLIEKIDLLVTYGRLFRNFIVMEHKFNSENMNIDDINDVRDICDPDRIEAFRDNYDNQEYGGYKVEWYEQIKEGTERIEGYRREVEQLSLKKNLPPSLDELQQTNPSITQDGADFVAAVRQENQFAHHPEAIAAYNNCLRRAKGREIKTPFDANLNLTRGLAMLMENVHYDKNWKPLTEEDRQKHQRNLERLYKIAEGDEGKREAYLNELVKEKLAWAKGLVEGLQLPTSEQLKDGWGIDLVKNKPTLAVDIIHINQALTCLYKHNTTKWVRDEMEKPENRKFKRMTDCLGTLFMVVDKQTSVKYGINLNAFSDAGASLQKDAALNATLIGPMLKLYQEQYDAYQQENNK